MLSPFDVVVVAQVVALLLLLRVVQHHHRGVEVDDLPCGQQVKVGAAVPPAVAVPSVSVKEDHVCSCTRSMEMKNFFQSIME